MSDVQTFDPEVEQRLERVTQRFNEFVSHKKTEIIKSKEAFTTRIKQLHTEHRELLKQFQVDAQRELDLQQQIEREISDANTSESRLADLRLKEKQLAEDRKTLEKQVVELKERVDQRRNELSKLKENQQRQGELDLPETIVYEQLLGFRIDGIQEDLLRFVFVNIDSKDSKKEFSLDLDVSEHIYKVLNSQPSLPQEEVGAILMHLNESRDLTHFLKSVRAAFKKI